MFYCCSALTAFSSNLSSLTNGIGMFMGSNLKSFTSDLSSLTDGNGMFDYCSLDTASVKNIADTINTNNGIISIGVDENDHDIRETYYQQIRDKGWDVYITINESSSCCDSGYCCSSCCSSCCDSGYYYAANASLASSTMTLDELGESEMFNLKPYWAKHIQSDEEHAKYIDAQGNFYNILGGHYIYVDDPETYGMFTSLENAVANMRLTKKGEEPIETS